MLARSLPGTVSDDAAKNLIDRAHYKVKKILSEKEPYRLTAEKEKAIDDIVKHAAKMLA